MTDNIYVAAVNKVPRGETRSFGEIAMMAGKPKAPRAAGRVLSSYPSDGKAAWHRAVTTRGGLSNDPERARIQLELLRREGARPRADETVAEWASRVRAKFVGYYRNGIYAEPRHSRAVKFDPLYVERIASEQAGFERGFENVDDSELRQMAIRSGLKNGGMTRAPRRPVVLPKKKTARR